MPVSPALSTNEQKKKKRTRICRNLNFFYFWREASLRTFSFASLSYFWQNLSIFDFLRLRTEFQPVQNKCVGVENQKLKYLSILSSRDSFPFSLSFSPRANRKLSIESEPAGLFFLILLSGWKGSFHSARGFLEIWIGRARAAAREHMIRYSDGTGLTGSDCARESFQLGDVIPQICSNTFTYTNPKHRYVADSPAILIFCFSSFKSGADSSNCVLQQLLRRTTKNDANPLAGSSLLSTESDFRPWGAEERKKYFLEKKVYVLFDPTGTLKINGKLISGFVVYFWIYYFTLRTIFGQRSSVLTSADQRRRLLTREATVWRALNTRNKNYQHKLLTNI